MKTIPLTQGQVALVDDADFDWLNSVNWFADVDNCGFYARRKITSSPGKQRTVGMHQLLAAVMGFSKPDHKDGNGLNNQRSNLRPATASQNNANRRLPSDNKSGYRGVRFQAGRWEANISFGGKTHYLGRFDSPEEAAQKYDTAARAQFGEFAKLNFHEQTTKIFEQD